MAQTDETPLDEALKGILLQIIETRLLIITDILPFFLFLNDHSEMDTL